MKAIFVKLQCITNLHVGNGDVNYNIIDNEVEKDPVTNLPTINSSGIKGALRQYFLNADLSRVVDGCGLESVKNGKDLVNEWFGKDGTEKPQNGKTQAGQSENQTDTAKKVTGQNTEGKLKILPAEFIAQPLRASKGGRAFYLATTSSAVSRYNKLEKVFHISEDFKENNSSHINDNEKVELEGISNLQCIKIAGEKVYRLEDKDFKNISLPVMARNKLENGISKNLWYEEVVPHESIFVFPVVAHDCDVELLKVFKKAIEGKLIQFGGNASIGDGLCLATAVEGRF